MPPLQHVWALLQEDLKAGGDLVPGVQNHPRALSLMSGVVAGCNLRSIMKLVNCPETFTPDMRCIMGESPSVRGYFVLAGMNSAGLSFGGGAGR